jgi:hypothetical protein
VVVQWSGTDGTETRSSAVAMGPARTDESETQPDRRMLHWLNQREDATMQAVLDHLKNADAALTGQSLSIYEGAKIRDALNGLLAKLQERAPDLGRQAVNRIQGTGAAL